MSWIHSGIFSFLATARKSVGQNKNPTSKMHVKQARIKGSTS